jgi:inner membrane protein
VLFIGLLDLAQAARHWSVPVVAVLDEPAHLATAALLLAALLPGRARALVPWALAGAVLIDLDHIPLYLWDLLTSDGSGRPVTHSLLTVLVLVCAGLLARTRTRTALLGLALGVALHLVRDLGTGPGVPLLWPLDGRSVLVPYAAYFAAVAAAAVIAAGRVPLARARARRKAVAAAIAAPYTP